MHFRVSQLLKSDVLKFQYFPFVHQSDSFVVVFMLKELATGNIMRAKVGCRETETKENILLLTDLQ